MNILVPGGAGYIGSCCVENLLDHGCEVTIYDSLIKGHREAVDPRARMIEADLKDRQALERVFSEGNFDGVIHCAAFIEAGESMTAPGRYFRNNTALGLNLLDAMIKYRVPRLVFSSTAAVYGNPPRVPIPEDAPLQPINPYGESKLMFEKMMQWYSQVHGLEYISLRYFNAAGATERCGEDHNPETHLIPLILQAALGQRKEITVFGEDYDTPDGTCIRDYIHVADLAEAHWLALRGNECGAFNLGTGSGYSVREIIETAKRVTGIDFPVRAASRRPGDPARLISDSASARKKLGWRPRHETLEEIIGSAWEWKKKQLGE